MQITLDVVLTRNEEITATDLDGDKVMMDLDKGKYFALNGVGGRIWDMLEKPHTPQQIITQLLEEYEVGQEECQEQVLKHLEQLKEYALVK